MSDYSPQGIINSANGFQLARDVTTLLRMQVYLLSQIAGGNMTAQQIETAANGFQLARSTETLLQMSVYLLTQILVGGGGGSAFSVPSGNYGGGAPNFTPAAGSSMAMDTSNGNVWFYLNGAWTFSGLTV